MLGRRLLTILIFSALLPAARAETFTPVQRAEIVQVVRDALRRDPDILREAIGALQDQEAREAQDAARDALRANRQALLADPADPVAGDPHGRVTLVEFYDPRCPYCRTMLPVFSALLRANPHLRLVYKDLPILGPASEVQSRALLAAARQGKYLVLQEAIMRGPPGADEASVLTQARAAGLDADRLAADMRDPGIAAHLAANKRLASTLRIQGTPALVIGDQMLSGATSQQELQRLVSAQEGRAPE